MHPLVAINLSHWLFENTNTITFDSKHGIVYIIQPIPGGIETPWVKIGQSRAIDLVYRRYITPYGGSLRILYWETGNRISEETQIHEALSKYHLEGELFSIDCIECALSFAASENRTVHNIIHKYVLKTPEVEIEDNHGTRGGKRIHRDISGSASSKDTEIMRRFRSRR